MARLTEAQRRHLEYFAAMERIGKSVEAEGYGRRRQTLLGLKPAGSVPGVRTLEYEPTTGLALIRRDYLEQGWEGPGEIGRTFVLRITPAGRKALDVPNAD